MLILRPISIKRVWGTNDLNCYSGDPSLSKIGSVYSMVATKNLNNEIINEPYQNKNLFDLFIEKPEIFGMKDVTIFPLIVAITGADENLSIQVHPDDKNAHIFENSPIGKTESWLFLSTPKNGYIYVDSKIDNKEKIKEEILKGNYENVVGKLQVEKGDFVHVPSGTLHALTKGSIVYEIQQGLDITYRLYDYDRKDESGNYRELHLDQGIKSIITKNITKKEKIKQNKIYEFKEYSLEYYSDREFDGYENKNNIFQVLTVIKGNTSVENYTLTQGMSIIILPNEKINLENAIDAIIATPNIYWK